MKRYIKEINGKKTIKYANKIVIIKNGFQIINPTEEMLLEDGWVEYIEPKSESQTQPELTDEEKVNIAKQELTEKILEYDKSDEVNICYIEFANQKLPYWADKFERGSLKSAVQDCINCGRENYRLDLRELGIFVEVNCESALHNLSKLEVYAIDCYNTTTDHLFAVNNLTTIEELENYNYRENYPEKIILVL